MIAQNRLNAGSLVFVCSPFRGFRQSKNLACRIAKFLVTKHNLVPVVPHLYFPLFLNDEDQEERRLGLDCAKKLLQRCSHLALVLNQPITRGMIEEITTFCSLDSESILMIEPEDLEGIEL